MIHPLVTTQNSQVTLELHFDADQEGSDLSHELRRDTPNGTDPNPETGPHADSLYFAAGEQLGLQITGHGAAGGDVPPGTQFVSFQVIDCVITTRPQVIQRGIGLTTKYAVPSPFQQAVGACYPVALDFSASASGLDPDNERTVTQTWKRTLDIGVTPGLWELSLVLTVRIVRGPGSVEELRVLSFDPETEVGGNGTLKL
jgi:hypothetical protein